MSLSIEDLLEADRWIGPLVLKVLAVATRSHSLPTEEARETVHEVIDRFHSEAHEHDMEAYAFWTLTQTALRVAGTLIAGGRRCDHEEHFASPVFYDADDNLVDNPDAAVSDDWGRSHLTMVRMLVAWINHDDDMVFSLWQAAVHEGYEPELTIMLVELAGQATSHELMPDACD